MLYASSAFLSWTPAMSGAVPLKSWTTLVMSDTGSADQLMPVAADGLSAVAVCIFFISSCRGKGGQQSRGSTSSEPHKQRATQQSARTSNEPQSRAERPHKQRAAEQSVRTGSGTQG